MRCVRNAEVGRWCETGLLTASAQKLGEGASVISQFCWGSRERLAALNPESQRSTAPQFWLCGGNGELLPIRQRLIVDGPGHVEPILLDDVCVGYKYEDADADYAWLSGVLPSDPSRTRKEQTFSVFERLEKALIQIGMSFSNVVRTWFYLDSLLEWYGEFNQVRDAFFHSRHVYDGVVPASTGIGSSNYFGTALTAGALAVRSKRPGVVTYKALPSPLQCPALQYGSSFSRAVELVNPSYRTVLVSGTASLEPSGETAFIGDIERQTDATMRAVEAILHSRQMDWQDTTRGILYLKHAEYLPVWKKWERDHLPAGLPISVVMADVCRDNFLVELELDAVKETEESDHAVSS
ncbi:MAG: hypothetical protein IKR48_01670 [Kiritimatiellae bacterium]|nr:hypothetical protein [Kiritimatiellia bacterium]